MKVQIIRSANPLSWYHNRIGYVYDVYQDLPDENYYTLEKDRGKSTQNIIHKYDCEIIKEVDVNEKHEKYCKHSKYANKLCQRASEQRHCKYDDNFSIFYTDKIDHCPFTNPPEVIEKDLIDHTIKDVMNIDDQKLYYCERVILRKLLLEYVKRLEAERKPCSECYYNKEYNGEKYCKDCGRKL